MFLCKKLTIGLTALLVCLLSLSTAAASASTPVPQSKSFLLYFGKNEAYINGSRVILEAPAIELKDKAYIPAAILQETLGISVKWDSPSGSVQVTTPSAFLSFQLSGKKLFINGAEEDYSKAAFIQNDRLYIGLDWLKQYVGYKLTVNKELQRAELVYVTLPGYTGFYNDTMPNAKPIAKFSVNKERYRLGEPIYYSDLSYDPDGDAITKVDWTGKADTIFEPGLFKVSLKVTDSRGTESNVFSHNVEIINEPFLDPFEHKVYYEPVGTFVKDEEATLRKYLRGIPQLPNVTSLSVERPLIVSDSPETFEKKGFLYQEKVNGKARLYADHVNGMKEKVQFAIVARNANPNAPVRITTTRQGEVYPSIYANLIGNEASIEFLQSEMAPETMVVEPAQTVYYKKMPEFFPDQGMNVIYDVETDGEVYFSFVAMDAGAGLDTIGTYKQLEYTGNVRGTFSGSDVSWNVDAKSFTKPSSLAIGDGTSDMFVTGKDFFTKQDSLNLGNYGVVYKIHVDRPRKMSVLLLPRGGVFRGPVEVNGQIVQTPPSGVMMDYEGYTILARTDGTEPSLDIEFTPAAGSAFPVDVIFYPLEDK
ncbi:copper amine oxidase N-terminal domain-containing protein [Paenibacillus radicis (ex Xue et al. 2023)]|uniref:Copper amine oxidase N-terminal domain-containing protein n=1 Tax=Paenibacillus radicis (ex Xue et al. 2023) TaxID=2972489 RepID=A0ABT1YH68_9BACL|nr:copper amine oxidase N-terminal domain-containing protein [Paenibacillus radicis (ex Xue et al. 2023)]MCR8631754.1 copper amine oxidase N-terminal domain-containing protein [Paenibacillus radicis (ex Xue et al. 2023)]